MPVGRPPFYSTVEDLQIAIDGYFDSYLVMHRERPTITGLALYLGFTSRQAILNYQEKPEFVDAIKKAKLRVEAAYEQAMFSGNAAGPIFALKNFGWTDKQEIDQKTEHSGSIAITWENPPVQNTNDKGSD
jgi:hypothetical protein